MPRITEKVVASRTPATVEINLDELPDHENDALCRVLIRSVTEAFKNPKFAADYEKWRAARYANQNIKEATT
jgi:hypothetical protein